MINNSIIGETSEAGPIANSSSLRPENGGAKKKVIAKVMLTSLVDAFSILVIYLLVSFSNSGEMITLSEDMVLPTAAEAAVLKRSTIIRLEKDGKLFIEDEEVDSKNIVARLIQLKKSLQEKSLTGEKDEALILQADETMKYKDINRIIHASSQSGFSEIKFAVISAN